MQNFLNFDISQHQNYILSYSTYLAFQQRTYLLKSNTILRNMFV